MNFDLSDEQRQLRDSLERLLSNRYQFEQRQQYCATDEGFSRDVWAAYAELGLLGLAIPAEYDGFDGSAVDTMLVMNSLGSVLSLEPFLATVVLGANAVLWAGAAEQKQAILPGVASGRLLLAWAHEEPDTYGVLHHVAVRAAEKNGHWRLTGRKSTVLHGRSADKIIVTARRAGVDDDMGGIGLYLVDASDPGVIRRSKKLRDGTPAASIELVDAAAEPLGCLTDEESFALVERVVQAGAAASAAAAVGAMERSLRLTVDYLKVRQQFGRPLAENQALQHRLVDMLVALEQARSSSLLATMALGYVDAVERRHELSAALMVTGSSSRFVGQQAVQLHGGIGMTEEYPVGHYFRFLAVNEQLSGDADQHASELSAMR
ncbi:MULTISPECIES: acyl-CoA dehydrogenase family protein [Burkholderia]|uniref:Acyl-CoA dehydrogenase n=1 Tax=Burkholderia pseudomultivorans TaxID=1207504 RepID=A0ABU2EC98_9BURK|nr:MULTISPECIES: acyl-CoA dehydrogenase family protein [Burkholderia]MDR8731477.1 Acyl-CoA dehydrogenase [Burkholderia pseudomultivorans]MDR8738759.1 Acyl-CoA dehydrogenase [Burkholderia pseudomultivorans]MDR8745408.1 Acyl-CoA dehydrogenase [Burkholderia pseudomultivorans]MDR8757498.1 Acyl-CoA dehydrogenase [Burkholderia pseudomultivorans]MDR8781654.1 Acyl-CoA dehydrogenase [Burkholderia pseudomultivorans]